MKIHLDCRSVFKSDEKEIMRLIKKYDGAITATTDKGIEIELPEIELSYFSKEVRKFNAYVN